LRIWCLKVTHKYIGFYLFSSPLDAQRVWVRTIYCNKGQSIKSCNPCKEQKHPKQSKNPYPNRKSYQSKANPCANRASFFKQTPNKVMQVHVQKGCPSIQETRGVSHCGLAIYIKMYLKAKEELWKLKYFTMQKYNLHKILWKKPKSFKIL